MISEKVMYTLHYGSILNLDKQLIIDLYENQHALGDSALFFPRIFTHSCLSDCSAEVKEEMCVSDGSYCLVYDDLYGFNGIDIMRENLREKCIESSESNKFRDG